MTDRLSTYVSAFLSAIDEELKAIREEGGNRIPLRKRQHLGQDVFGTQYYRFRAEADVGIPDDSPIELEVGNVRVNGHLVRAEGFHVLLAVESKLPDPIDHRDILITDPTFILTKLKSRLEDVQDNTGSPSYNTKLALKLLETAGEPEPETNTSLVNSYVKGLNAEQAEALKKAFSRDLTYVWGPPGTGKTFTIANMVAAFLDQGKSVLLLAHSNVAVDTVTLRVAEMPTVKPLIEKRAIVRTGYPRLDEVRRMDAILGHRIAQELLDPVAAAELEDVETRIGVIESRMEKGKASDQDRNELRSLLQIRRNLRNKISELEKFVIQWAALVATTLSRSAVADAISERRYDVVIVDEASMAYMPHLFWTACLSRHKLVIVGDFRQLGPVVKTRQPRAQELLKRDAFQAAGLVTDDIVWVNDPRMASLRLQHRMHPEISRLVDRIYNGRLRDAEETQMDPDRVITAEPFPGNVVTLVDTSDLSSGCRTVGRTRSRLNESSAQLAVRYAAEAVAAGVQEVAVITPYIAQAQHIQHLLEQQGLENVIASTVHRFQGSEKSLVIMDLVESRPQRYPGRLVRGGIGSDAMRLINVAITRAKKKLVILADRHFLSRKLGNQDTVHHILKLLETQYKVYNSAGELLQQGTSRNVDRSAARTALSEPEQTPEHTSSAARPTENFATICPQCQQPGATLRLSSYGNLYVRCTSCRATRPAELADLLNYILTHDVRCLSCAEVLSPQEEYFGTRKYQYLFCPQCGERYRWANYLRQTVGRHSVRHAR